MKIAVVSPLPPSPSGIADYTLDVVRALGGSHEIELFHDQAHLTTTLPAPAFSIAELKARGAVSKPFDAVLYQMGNAPVHDFMYDWMERVRGIVVLHDLVLHHAFARRFLDSPRPAPTRPTRRVTRSGRKRRSRTARTSPPSKPSIPGWARG